MSASNRPIAETDSNDHPPNSVLDQGQPAVIGAAPCVVDTTQSVHSNHHLCRKVSELEEPCAAAMTAAFRTTTLEVEEEPKSVIRIERETFLLFVKILFKVLEDDPPVRTRAERIVVQCRRRSQMGDPAFLPLMSAVERHLRALVGEATWRRVHLLVHHRLSTARGERSPPRDRPTAILAGKS